MSAQFTWLKPYARLEEGMAANVLIGFAKAPYLKQNLTIIQWRYVLYLDLWLLKVTFNWLGKENPQ